MRSDEELFASAREERPFSNSTEGYDPANKSCKTCIHFSHDDGDPETGAPEVIWCSAQSKELQHAETPVVSCPLWRDRDEEEDEPAEDAWDHGLRGLTVDGGAR